MPESNPIAEIRALQALAATANFGSAATHLGVSQSSVSRRIQALEERLGGKRLVARTTRSVRLTEAGQKYLRGALAAIEQLHRAEQAHLEAEQAVRGTLRMSLPSAMGRAVILPVLAQVADAHPHLTLELDFANRYVDLIDDRVDLAIRNRPTEATGIRDENIGASILLLVCSREYALAYPDVKEGTFADARFILPRNEHRQGVDSLASRLQIDGRNVRFFTDDIAAVLSLVEHHQGIAALPSALVREGLEHGSLVSIDVGFKLPTVQHYASYPNELGASPRLQVVVAAISAALQSS